MAAESSLPNDGGGGGGQNELAAKTPHRAKHDMYEWRSELDSKGVENACHSAVGGLKPVLREGCKPGTAR